MSPANDRFLRACRRQSVDRVPVWFMRQAGRYMKEYRKLRERHSILELAKTPELAAEVTLMPLRAFAVDGAVLFADIVLPLEGMGVSLEIRPDVGPVIHNPVRALADVERLRVPAPEVWRHRRGISGEPPPRRASASTRRSGRRRADTTR